MIFILHYILFNAGLSSAVVLLTLFLQCHSHASLTQIGTLLMVLPFVSILVKPLFCALADRRQAHKAYLIGSLLCMSLGYGSLVVAPFWPEFIEQQSELVWYLDVAGIVLGYSAFGVAWSLGDSLALNAAIVNGVPWSSYRAWATFSWGFFGWIVGQFNETPLLPRYTPGFIMLAVSLVLESLLIAFWPAKHFDMSAGELAEPSFKQQQQELSSNGRIEIQMETSASLNHDNSSTLPQDALAFGSGSTARPNPRLIAALANLVVEDFGNSLKSSFRLGNSVVEQKPRRSGLAGLLGEQPSKLSNVDQTNQLDHLHQEAPSNKPGEQFYELELTDQSSQSHMAPAAKESLGRAAFRRTQLGLLRMNSLSSRTGHAIADELEAHFETELQRTPQTQPSALLRQRSNATTLERRTEHQEGVGSQRPPMVMMSTLNSRGSLNGASAARALGLDIGPLPATGQLQISPVMQPKNGSLKRTPDLVPKASGEPVQASTEQDFKQAAEDLQLVLLKIIVKRDTSILKYLFVFTILGALLFMHIIYFFMHVEKLCREKGYDFSSVAGSLLAAQAVSEIFAFVIVTQYYMPRVGRTGSFVTVSLLYVLRYAYYGSYYAQMSPYWAILTECCHGFAYGIVYTLVTDIARESVNQLDLFIPELVELGVIDARINPVHLKLPLRATMQGVFSGAFDGFGNGLGALLAGLYLDYKHSYESLWLICALVALALAIVYPLNEWRRSLVSDRTNKVPRSSPKTQPKETISSVAQ